MNRSGSELDRSETETEAAKEPVLASGRPTRCIVRSKHLPKTGRYSYINKEIQQMCYG